MAMLFVVVSMSPVVLLIIFMVMVVVVLMAAVMVLVNDRVPLTTSDEVAVDREGRHERYGQSHR